MSYPNRIYILAGQSWMKGQFNGVNDIPAPYKDVYQLNSRIWTGSNFVAINSSLNNNQYIYQDNGASMEMFMTDIAKSLNNDIYILKLAKGGAGLALDIAEEDWNVGSTEELYDTLVTMISGAKTWMTDRGKSYVFKGIVWWQGEEDSIWETKADDYGTNLGGFYNNLCLEIGYTVPIYQYNVQEPPSGNRDYRATVNDFKASFTAADTENRKLFDADVTSWNPDNIHPTLAEYKRMFDEEVKPLIIADL